MEYILIIIATLSLEASSNDTRFAKLQINAIYEVEIISMEACKSASIDMILKAEKEFSTISGLPANLLKISYKCQKKD